MATSAQRMNARRVRDGAKGIAAFKKATNADRETLLTDMLADLMHWSRAKGVDFDNELRIARSHFETEVNEARKTLRDSQSIELGTICRCPGPDYCEDTLRGEPCKGESDGN